MFLLKEVNKLSHNELQFFVCSAESFKKYKAIFWEVRLLFRVVAFLVWCLKKGDFV